MYQNRVSEVCKDLTALIKERYGFDLEALNITISGQEGSTVHVLCIQRGDDLLVEFSWEPLLNQPQYHELVEYCSIQDGIHFGVGEIVKTRNWYLDSNLRETEQNAFGHIIPLLLMSLFETVLLEEQDLKMMPAAFLETWCSLYGIRDVHRIQFDGVRYLKCDDPASPTAW